MATPDRESKRKIRSCYRYIAVSAKFMSVVPDDLLVEIFLRFPTSRSVMQCATVCKRWCSLIINPYSRKFIRTFIQYHLRKQSLDSSYTPSQTTNILFNYSQFNYGPHYLLCSEESKPKAYDISFMPDWEDLAIRAASGDLLLLSRGNRHYFIFNSITRQCLALPEAPPFSKYVKDRRVFDEDAAGSFGFAIVSDPVDIAHRYKVVLLYRCCFSVNNYNFFAAIFDSEIGLWTVLKRFFIPIELGHLYSSWISFNTIGVQMAIASNGVLHWLDGMKTLECLIVFDPFLLKPSFVHLPTEQLRDIRPDYSKCKVRLGVVRGRVRLSLMQLAHKPYGLRVWELDSDSYTWLLVHDFDFGENTDGEGGMFFVLAFDPNDGNILFLVQGEHIYRYEIEQNKYEKICEFPCNGEPIDEKKLTISKSLKVSTLVHPLWPTQLLRSHHLLQDAKKIR